MDPIILIVILGAAAAGFVQGLSGFAFAMTAMSFWAWALEPQLAAVLVVFCSLVGQIMTITSARAGFSWSRILPFVIGGALGVPLGAAILPLLDQKIFRIVLGMFLIFWCSTMLLSGGRLRLTHEKQVSDGGVGVLGGILGGLGGLSGALPTLWCSLKNWDKNAQRAVIQVFNLTMHTLTLTVYLASGLITLETTRWLAIAVPAMLIPSYLGAKLYTKVSDQTFRRIVLYLLLASGVALVGISLATM